MTIRTNCQHLQSGRTRTLTFRLLAALLASSIALAANMALLSIAGAARINTGQGGLLRLFAMMIRRLARSFRLRDGLSNLQLPSSATFHILTGLAMAVAYALIIEPRLPGRPFSKGLAYGTVVWCFNAFLVLPLIDEGLAGSRSVNTEAAVRRSAFAGRHSSGRQSRIAAFRSLFCDLLSDLKNPQSSGLYAIRVCGLCAEFALVRTS